MGAKPTTERYTVRSSSWGGLVLVACLVGMLLAVVIAQIPVTHTVDLGGYDAAYVRGFFDADTNLAESVALAGSDGRARWSRAESFLLFPQAGLPARVTLRLRGHASDRPPASVRILVNGVLAQEFVAGGDWQEVTVPVTGGLFKPEDVLLTIQSTTTQNHPRDTRQVGVLVDQVVYQTGPLPVLPYPAQVVYAGLVAGLLVLLFTGPRLPGWPHGQRWLLAGFGVLVVVLVLTRMPSLISLRGLMPGVAVLLAGVLAVRHTPLLARSARLPFMLALVGGLVWGVFLLRAADQHLVLSVPGVEKDFRVFATRAGIAEVLKADGFYNLGYPLILWLVRPFTLANAFLAGRLIAALSAGLLLAATWRMATLLLPQRWAVLALVVLAFSPLVVQYGLYVGSDMPFAALCAWAVVLLVELQQHGLGHDRRRVGLAVLAGVLGGVAFLIRHPGLVLLLVGAVCLWKGTAEAERRMRNDQSESRWWPLLAFLIGFVLAITPQLVVNMRDTGALFYSQQAKNIWLAVYADGDWGRWGEANNAVGLAEIVLRDPGRFFHNQLTNLQGFVGSGGEDTSESGRAIQLRLLGFPANWLAVLGLLAWVLALVWRGQRPGPLAVPTGAGVLLLWLVGYVLVISVGFALPRFFLPLTPLYAVAAAWAMRELCLRMSVGQRASLALGLVLVALVWGGFQTGTSYVVRAVDDGSSIPGQPVSTLAMAQLIMERVAPDSRVMAQLPADDEEGLALTKYSAVAHLFGTQQESEYLLWSEALGTPPNLHEVGQAGPYRLLQVQR